MSTPIPDTLATLAMLVGRAGTGAARAGALVQLARVIDEQAADARPLGPLVLPRLQAIAGVVTVDPDDPDDPAVRELVAAVAAVEPDAGPTLLGQVHEALLDADQRHDRGAFYTPHDVAGGIVGEVIARLAPNPDDGPPRICDPALGGGVFLLAAADALVARGFDPADVIEHGLWGSDVDPLAAAVAEAALILWARARGADGAHVNVVCADPLTVGAQAWADPPAGGFDAVVGNPPFLNQLGSGTARDPDAARALRDRWGPAVFRYTDTAAIFLLVATELTAPGGVVAMIVPVPVLVTGDAARVRSELLDRAVPEHLWIAHDDVFSLGVRVCAPVLRMRTAATCRAVAAPREPSAPHMVTRSKGRSFDPVAACSVDLDDLRAAGTWGSLVADAFGVPALARSADGDRAGRLGDFCTATAGFRDQYYGLRPYVFEAGASEGPGASEGSGAGRRAKLVTSGLIDPARMTWGSRACRFDGRSWLAPAVDLDGLGSGDPALAAWTAGRLVPKVVVATQTRVLEAAVDVDGDWFPSVPTIALLADGDRLWDAAAVVLAPATTVWAMNRHIGAALAADALKVSAKQLLEAPLPSDREAWTAATAHLRAAAAAEDEDGWRAAMGRFGEAMTLAYAAPSDVLSWWVERWPRWR